MSFQPEGDFGNLQSTDGLLGAAVGNTTPIESFNAGSDFSQVDLSQVPQEYRGTTPTVKTLPPKVQKVNLPPKYETKKLPPKEVVNRLKPIFPPGVQPFDIPNF